jgi:hypothetical protein
MEATIFTFACAVPVVLSVVMIVVNWLVEY